ncbi:hypothetical protein JCGZ_02908 [Jatropha curcas]|uniref:Uncharacterized protein n=1 Tax=Jatropha curcas TaxID=180498 RepID=A0A067L4N9_JATCU|nr:hypothetical protein JCGZ_02908 [Jatropha curcas]
MNFLFHASRSDFSSRYLQKMIAQEGSPLEFTMLPYDYMSSLCPVASNNAKSKGPSRRDFGLQGLLCCSHINKRFLKGVLEIIFLFYLARVWWSSSSQITNLPANLRKPALAMLNMLAVERPFFKDWKFKESPDVAFIKLYPEIVKQQEEVWERSEKKLTDNLSHYQNRSKENTKPTIAQNTAKDLDAYKTAPKSASGNRVPTKKIVTAETREALLKVLPKVFQTHKVCSFEMIRQGLRDLAMSLSTLLKADPRITKLAADGGDAPLEELQEIISQVATNIHGSYILKSSPDHPEHDLLRKVVIDLLLANANLKRAECYGQIPGLRRSAPVLHYPMQSLHAGGVVCCSGTTGRELGRSPDEPMAGRNQCGAVWRGLPRSYAGGLPERRTGAVLRETLCP